MSKIMVIGLVSTEQIVGKVDEDWMDKKFITIKNPAILVAQEKGLGMGPWLYYYTNAEKEGAVINMDNVVFAAECRQELANQYNAQYGNGLVLPANQVQTPELKIVAE